MTPAIAAILGMYGAFMAVGWMASRKVREGVPADLIVAGRSMPVWIAALTHLVYGLTLGVLQPLGRFVPYRQAVP